MSFRGAAPLLVAFALVHPCFGPEAWAQSTAIPRVAAAQVRGFFASQAPSISTLFPAFAALGAGGAGDPSLRPLVAGFNSAAEAFLQAPRPVGEAESLASAEKMAALLHPLVFQRLSGRLQERILDEYRGLESFSHAQRAHVEKKIEEATRAWENDFREEASGVRAAARGGASGPRLTPAAGALARRIPAIARDIPSLAALPYEPAAPGTLGLKAFSLLPGPVRRGIAGRAGEALRREQIRLLNLEVAELMPEGTFSFMAALGQTSQDYLVLRFPQIAEAAARVERTIARNKDWPDHRADFERRDAQKAAWFQRLGQVRDKLEEIRSLQQGLSGPDVELRRAMNELMLGVFYGFSYGFATGISGGGDRDFVGRATAHYKEALRLVEARAGGDSAAANVVRYLLGKHALNAAQAHSNAGLYSMSGQAVPAEPEAFELLALAADLLTRVEADSARAPELRYDARLRLLDIRAKIDLLRSPPPAFGAGRRSPQAAEIERILVDLLRAAPREWVEAQLRDSSGLLERLITSVRWARYPSANAELHALQMSIGSDAPLSYEAFIDGLARAGYPSLKPIQRRLL